MSVDVLNIQFDQSPSGRWFYVTAEGVRYEHVLAVRSFPVAAPDEGIALVNIDGSFITPSTWDIETDRGRTALLLKGEEDIRRLSGTVLLVTDGHGIQFLIRDLAQMDRTSRKLLDRFL